MTDYKSFTEWFENDPDVIRIFSEIVFPSKDIITGDGDGKQRWGLCNVVHRDANTDIPSGVGGG